MVLAQALFDIAAVMALVYLQHQLVHAKRGHKGERGEPGEPGAQGEAGSPGQDAAPRKR